MMFGKSALTVLGFLLRLHRQSLVPGHPGATGQHDLGYLGGHSTGGTLALLTAEMGQHFRAVFALGPVGDVRHYGQNLMRIDFDRLTPLEAKLRSPLHGLHGIAQPTYLIEGKDQGNTDSLRTLCAAAASNPLVHCLQPAGFNHFSVIDAATRQIAARMVQAQMVGEFALSPDAFERR